MSCREILFKLGSLFGLLALAMSLNFAVVYFSTPITDLGAPTRQTETFDDIDSVLTEFDVADLAAAVPALDLVEDSGVHAAFEADDFNRQGFSPWLLDAGSNETGSF